MVNEENSILWKKILGEIQTEISKGTYITLFKSTMLLSLEKGIASIAVPSTMIIDLLQKRFYEKIKKILDKYTGINTKIIFVPKVISKNTSKQKESAPLFEQAEFEEKKTISLPKVPRVRPDYTFQTLAVSSSNQLAYVSAPTVA